MTLNHTHHSSCETMRAWELTSVTESGVGCEFVYKEKEKPVPLKTVQS